MSDPRIPPGAEPYVPPPPAPGAMTADDVRMVQEHQRSAGVYDHAELFHPSINEPDGTPKPILVEMAKRAFARAALRDGVALPFDRAVYSVRQTARGPAHVWTVTL